MKTLYTYIGFLFLALTVFCACTDESEFLQVEEGNDVRLIIDVRTQANKDVVVSRASTDETLYDLHFYVFNAQGKLTGYEKLESDTGKKTSHIPENVTIRTKTGQSYIYAVANINNGSTYFLNDSDKNLLNVTEESTGGMADAELESKVLSSTLTRDVFLNINFNRRYSAGEHQNFSPTPTDNIFMMSGYLNDGNSVTIKKGAGGNVGIDKGDNVIKLYRVLAQNTLTINSTGNGKFTPKSYRLYNVPKSGVLIPNANISTANGSGDNYTTGDIVSFEVESSYIFSSSTTTFTFYYPENLQSSVSGIGAWKEREENSYDGSKFFTNAPAKAAYIEIQGDYISKDGKTTANVSYTIHLGNFSTQDRLGDFNVIRNNNYIYTVTIKDVEDIIAEAKVKDAEGNSIDNPYAEGLVIKVNNSGKHLDVDAHYESRVLTFTKSTIQALIDKGSGYILNINTPFGKTSQTVNVKYDLADGKGKVYTMDGSEICSIDEIAEESDLFDGEADYLWMKFVKNTTANKMDGVANSDINKYPCKYPGDGKESGTWLNVFELLAELYKSAIVANNTEDEVYYTCFIDENYYANKAWSEYVNKEPRTMQIANNLSVSTDKKSVYAEVAYSISQRSIATFYTNENVKAYGTEIVDEEDVYNNRLGSSNSIALYENVPIKKQDNWLGWTSAKETNVSTDTDFKGWYNYEDDYDKEIVILKENIQPLYKAAGAACMSRNRDLNGNGAIDENEVKWYLASVGQYRGLYLAQKVLPVDARLISDTELEEINAEYKKSEWIGDQHGHDFRGKYHYYTSSLKSNAGTFWPEEGLTNNPVQTNWVSRAELVRCVRTLESNDNGIADPDLYYTYTEETRSFDLNGIVVSRGYTNSPLLLHNETQDLNDLYTNFVVANNDLSTTHRSFDVAQGDDPCKGYKKQSNVKGTDEANYDWRSPNQKEMALMLSHISALQNGNYATRTKFSGNDKEYYQWHSSPGFGSENGSINLTEHSNAKVRCVRDKK